MKYAKLITLLLLLGATSLSHAVIHTTVTPNLAGSNRNINVAIGNLVPGEIYTLNVQNGTSAINLETSLAPNERGFYSVPTDGSVSYNDATFVLTYTAGATLGEQMFDLLHKDDNVIFYRFRFSANILVVGAPGTPTDLAATVIGTDVRFSWVAPSDTVTGYRLERRLGSSGAFTVINSAIAAAATSYRDAGLTANTAYQYRLAAINTNGIGGYSAIVRVTTLVSVDVNADGSADSDDALAIYYVAELGDTLGDSVSLQTTLLQSVRGSVEITVLLSNIDLWLASATADLNDDGTTNSSDALALYYVAELADSLDDSTSLQTTLLDNLRDGMSVSELFDRAQAVLDAMNGN